MQKFHMSGGSGREQRIRELSIIAVMAMMTACTLDKIPEGLRPTIEPRIPLVIGIAKSSAAQCAALAAEDANAEPPVRVSPAVDTALATDFAVVEILVRCVWADEAKGHDAAADPARRSFDFPPLRATQRHERGSSPTLVYDTRVKPGDPAFERIHMPSVYSELAGSADITAVEPIPGGGSVEVIVAVKQ